MKACGKSKDKQEEALDGKYLLSTSDESLSTEDIALGYKQLLEVERAFRTPKSSLSLRPIYHSKDHRSRSHVPICRLALLRVRLAEVETETSWGGRSAGSCSGFILTNLMMLATSFPVCRSSTPFPHS